MSLTFINYEKQTAMVEWTEQDGRKVYLDILPNSQKIHESVFSSAMPPSPVNITAISKETNAQLLLDSKASVTVTPKDSREMMTIKIGEGGFRIVCFYAPLA